MHTRHRTMSAALCLVLAAGALQGQPAASQPASSQAQPASSQAQPELPQAVNAADRLLADAQDAAAAARAWLRENLSREQLDSMTAAAEERVASAWAEALDVARQQHVESLGIFVLSQPGTQELWRRPVDTEPMPERLVLLVHGLDEAGAIWDDAAPALRAAGHAVAKFDYPNDQPIARSAESLAEALRTLRARGVRRVDLVAHSMGGLVSRDALTREGLYAARATGHDDLPDVTRLIMLGTPNHGSPLAPLRGAMEVREQFARWIESDGKDPRALLGFLVDGNGEAAADLLPGSAFLTELNSRPLPEGVRITSIEGRIGAPGRNAIQSTLENPFIRRTLGEEKAAKLAKDASKWIDDWGDGAVPAKSAALRGVSDVVVLDTDHRSMIRRLDALEAALRLVGQARDTPPAIPIILTRLAAGDAR